MSALYEPDRPKGHSQVQDEYDYHNRFMNFQARKQ